MSSDDPTRAAELSLLDQIMRAAVMIDKQTGLDRPAPEIARRAYNLVTAVFAEHEARTSGRRPAPLPVQRQESRNRHVQTAISRVK